MMEKIKISDLLTDKISGEWGEEDSLTGTAVNVIRTANFTNSGVITFHNIIKREIPQKKVDQKKLIDGDVIIEKSGGSPSQPVGRVVYFDNPDNATYLCNNFTTILRPDKRKVNPKYLFYLLYNYYQIGEVLSFQNKTTGIINLKLDRYLDSEISYEPDLETQNKIVAILDKAKAILDKREETIKKYEELLRATFLEMFGDPVKNEKDWETELLGKICDVGSSKRVFVEELQEDGIPFYRGTEIGQLAEYIDIFPTLFITENHYEQLKLHSGIPKIGDLLLPSICPDGRIWRVTDDNPFYFKDGRVLWIKVNEINSIYLQFALKAIFATNYSNIASGTTFAELKIVALKGIKIPVPPLNLQNRFASIIEKIEVIRAKLKKGKQQNENLYSGLSQLAFNGELTFTAAVDLEVLLENDYLFFKENSTTKSIQLLINRLNTDDLNENRFYEHQTYDKAKSFVFELLKEGKVKQVFDEETKKVKLIV